MRIRNYQAGDEAIQVAIYNEAAAELPKFKPATLQEVQRRTRASDFDAGARFIVEADGKPVGYANFTTHGRVSYPWLLKGHENLAQPLFAHMLQAMKEKGHRKALAAYRPDWTQVHDFFLQQGFRKVRDMVNFVMDLIEMPTPPARASSSITPMFPSDIPTILNLAPGVLRVATAQELEKYLFHNPYFQPDSLFVLRSRANELPVGAGILVADPTYANPYAVDSNMPCYRLGAFGTEGMHAKRINGLFSFLAGSDQNIGVVGLDLMGYAAQRLADTDVESFAAQVPSNVPALLRFYERNFRKQGSFPEFERDL
jgi:hypothetical protein